MRLAMFFDVGVGFARRLGAAERLTHSGSGREIYAW